MSKRTILSADTVCTQGFFETLDTVSTNWVDANSPSGKRTLGRTAAALGQLRDEAELEANERGYTEGFAQGQVEGEAQIRAEMEAIVDDFAATLQAKADQAIFALRDWTEQSEQRLAELAVHIAAKILGQEIQLPHDTITSLVTESLGEIRLAETARIRLNPFDHSVVELNRAKLTGLAPQLRNIEIVDDPSILGGCVIESDAGIIDATLQTRLELVLKSVKEAA